MASGLKRLLKCFSTTSVYKLIAVHCMLCWERDVHTHLCAQFQFSFLLLESVSECFLQVSEFLQPGLDDGAFCVFEGEDNLNFH